MDYADTSFLLKWLLPEPESLPTQRYVEAAELIVFSSLAFLEMRVQIRGFFLGGSINRLQLRRIESYVSSMKELEPFRFQELPGSVFQTAVQQLTSVPNLHCRTLNRLHLAAMDELGATVLLTFDKRQATAAKALGMQVVTP